MSNAFAKWGKRMLEEVTAVKPAKRDTSALASKADNLKW